MRKLVRKSYTPVVPIANTCSIGYPHDGRADKAAYRHDRRADNAAYRHDRRADSLSQFVYIYNMHAVFVGSGSTRPGTSSPTESTRHRVNSAGSTQPV